MGRIRVGEAAGVVAGGHLSNDATAEFLARDYDGGAAYIVLGHLSESNNAPELRGSRRNGQLGIG